MIAVFLTLIGMAYGQSCAEPSALPDSLQVVWVSPAGKGVRMNGWIEAVRVSELRAWLRDHDKDKVRLLKHWVWRVHVPVAGSPNAHTK